jgi:hypothetical protein
LDHLVSRPQPILCGSYNAQKNDFKIDEPMR